MPSNKNHHWVPKFLLRRFALPGSEERSIVVADLRAKRFYDSASIRQQCSRDYLYGKAPEMEKLLCELEGKAAEVIRNVVSSKTFPSVYTREGFDFLAFIAIQHGRTPGSAREALVAATGLARGMLSLPRPGYTPPSKEILQHLEMKHSAPEVAMLQIGANLSPHLFDLEDLLIINETNLDFVLSDLGVVYHNEWARGSPGAGAEGVCCQGLQVFLPLSPRHLWVKYDPFIYKGAKGAVSYARNLTDVERINRLMISASEQNVYFSGERRTREMLADFDSHVRRPLHQRVQVLELRAIGVPQVAYLDVRKSDAPCTELSVLKVSTLAAFVPMEFRAQMYRHASMSVKSLDGSVAVPPESSYPEWLREGRYVVTGEIQSKKPP